MPANRAPAAVCLLGPTAAGKTDIAVQLAKRFPFEIISVDSAMVYRGMDIGTAKPGPQILADVPHRLIDIREPWETYSTGQFCRDAGEMIDEIVGGGQIPLLVGGTSLYFHALQKGIAPLPRANVELRMELDQRAALDGWPSLHAELLQIDPDAAERIQPNDGQRIQRALEVFRLTGERITDLQRIGEAPDIRFVRIALLPGDRAELHRRIEARFRGMLQAGFIDEVRRLRDMPQMTSECPAMRAVGYRQLWEYLDGLYGRNAAEERAITATRRLAKRQLTWMRAAPESLEFDCLDPQVSARVVDTVEAYMDEIR